MSYYPYMKEKSDLWFTAKEASFRTNATGKDTWKADAVTYCLPVEPEHVVTYKKNTIGYYERANTADLGIIQSEGFGEGMLEISGLLFDLSLLYFLCKACTTADATPGAGLYTHTYATSTARTVPPPSFQMIRKFENDTAAEGLWILYTGCIVQHFECECGTDQHLMQGMFRILFANAIYTTTDYSGTEPTRGALRCFQFESTSITLTKATVAYQMLFKRFKLSYDDGTVLDKSANEANPERAFNGPRMIELELGIVPMEKQVLIDFMFTDLDPAAANDLDCTIKTARHSTDDFLQFALEKLSRIGVADDLAFSPLMAEWTLRFAIKPVAQETGAKLTITEVNALDDDRYET